MSVIEGGNQGSKRTGTDSQLHSQATWSMHVNSFLEPLYPLADPGGTEPEVEFGMGRDVHSEVSAWDSPGRLVDSGLWPWRY